jgi:hypothetical protein
MVRIVIFLDPPKGQVGTGIERGYAQYTARVEAPQRRASDVTLKIPRPLYERLAHVIEGTGFRSVTEFCVYVLRDLVATHDSNMLDAGMTPDETAVVRQRLRSLGYLDG